MNLSGLFQMQKILDDHIMDEHPELKGQDNMSWKVLALQVELGECANEWRGFKKWSKNQKPVTHKLEIGFKNPSGPFEYFRNPLLEEYVDCLHFFLSIGLEIGDMSQYNYYPSDSPLNLSLIDTFTSLITDAESLRESDKERNYIMLFCRFISLGEKLGFTWEQIEQAYFEKNAVNHQRQEHGY